MFGRKSNATDHFGSFRQEYLGPPWKAVHFDQSFRSVWPKRPFPFEKVNCFSLQPLFGSLLKSTISRRDVAWVGSVQPMFISIGQTGIFVQWKAPLNRFHGPFLKILVSVVWQLNLFIFISRTLAWEWFNTETPYLKGFNRGTTLKKTNSFHTPP